MISPASDLRLLRPFGLTLWTVIAPALAVLAMIDGLLIGQLAVYAVVEYSTLSRSLDGLEAAAFGGCETYSKKLMPSNFMPKSHKKGLTASGSELFVLGKRMGTSFVRMHNQSF